MAMNLRLDARAEAALRAEAKRSGRSQQDIVREAVERLLGLRPRASGPVNDREALLVSGLVRPPRRPYRKLTPSLVPPSGTNSLELLDRDDRF